MAQHGNCDIPVTNDSLGRPLTAENKILTAGAAVTQDFRPVKNICAHLNAFHAYAREPSRSVETNHYCAHINNDVRQCLLYDSDEPTARLIGIEYMITPTLYATLPQSERKLWHSHIFEVKSGMLIMPNRSVPGPAWEVAEHMEMAQVVELYGKAYHLWQVDRGDTLPLGEPQLMTSFTAEGQMEDFEGRVGERDRRFGEDWVKKREGRRDIREPVVHPDADQAWKTQS